MTLYFQKATQASSHLRMALCGGPGAGKTWTSFALASGLGQRIALLDTERGSASNYAGDFNFDMCELESFHPQHYIDGMMAACQEGYDVLIIDSLSHAWAGKDGALELVDRACATGKANRSQAWRHVTPWHHQLMDTMLRLPLHLIVTLRTKIAYIIEADAGGNHVPRQVGLAPIQREGCEYEFDVMGEMHQNILRITKTRLRFLHGLVLEPDPQDPITPGRELGRGIAADLQETPIVPAAPPAVSLSTQQVSHQALKALWARITHDQINHDTFRNYLTRLGVHSTRELTPEQLGACLREIDTWHGRAFEPHDAADSDSATSQPELRAQLVEALHILQAEIEQAEPTREPGASQEQALIDLAQWVPRVMRACEHPETPASQLENYLLEVHEARDELRQLLTRAAVA